MAINYNDERFTNLKNEETAAKNESNSTYDSLINESGQYYDNLINQSKEWADKQADIQNQQTEFAIDKIEQQKQKAEKDYTKEQKGAYQDYMKQSNAYGSNMQAMGQQGLSGSGWSETIQSGFYNTYQNRYAQARESYNEIIMNYDNNIKEAQLQNSATLANIYAQAAKEQLELALQSFTVIKDLKLNKLNQSIALDNEYNNRWRQVETQINTENALAEQIRQYNESLAEQKRQADMDQAYRNASLALEREKFNYQKAQDAASSASLTSGSSGSSSSKKSSSSSSKSSSSGSSSLKGSKSSSTKTSSSKSSSKVKLSNGKTGYTSAIKAYSAAGGGTPYTESALLSKGLVKKTTYKGTTYYYYVGGSKGFSNSTYNKLK
jgi:hypothetical protein